ncbi:hypothetical protein PC129_g16436 [Phytophthora cactorum]|uniref:Uncharacterized protein n=1 Tax=Phytophthora cactorum TaxID=29920 RepID=A0A8T1B377_9STRA|nr:hypothetical protein Pcac1_g28428 [Phytophthora cactorum]KAG2803982.1 hypothetical protein PC111_g18458 [Phytophthora cactorum]KAG2819457.1 hypothetical protein PC112_g12172 [Phytophthora cactorum]KAG2841570.1 hypothetical protein PC113_g19004 [Phytophthora cactorum]KAG2883176.1 hypothetical protein PC114_g20694 [Phytophthora cactorum]
MARIKCVGGVLLLCVVSVYGGNPVGELDQLVAAKVEETQRAFVNVEKQLSEAQQMTELFALEDTQLQLFILETRAKLTVVQEEVQNEMDAAMLEVDRMRQEAVKNITTWKKRLQELREATQKNEQTLQNIREKKEKQKREIQRELELQKEQEMKAKRELEMLQELERQREVKKELEEKDLKRLQELEQQELEKQRVLEQLQVLEKQQQIQQELEKMRELEKQQKEMQKASSFDSEKSSDGADNTLASDDTQRTSTIKRVLTCASSGGNFGLLSRVNGANREIQRH